MLAFSAGTPERLKIESQHIFDLSGLYPLPFFDQKGLSTIREAAFGIYWLITNNKITTLLQVSILKGTKKPGIIINQQFKLYELNL